MSESDVTRTEDGRFVKGVSGNPAGRPPSRRNQITSLQQELEFALRKNIRPSEIQSIIDKMVELAKDGSIGAAKIILDKVLPAARPSEDDKGNLGTIRVIVENLTAGRITEKPIEGEFVEQNDGQSQQSKPE